MNASEIIRAALAVATLAGLGLFYASQNHSTAINDVHSSAGAGGQIIEPLQANARR